MGSMFPDVRELFQQVDASTADIVQDKHFKVSTSTGNLQKNFPRDTRTGFVESVSSVLAAHKPV